MSTAAEAVRKAAARGEGRGGCGPAALIWLLAAGLWAFLLHDFVDTPVLVTLAVAGPTCALLGLYLVFAGLRHAFTSVWYFGAFLFGTALTVGGALSLAPQAPDALLVTTDAGWAVLDQRTTRFRKALETGDDARAHKLLRRGLGDAAPPGRSGQPLIDDIREPERLAALLALGLDADARDEQGRTLLHKTWDEALADVLLAAGADANARDDSGRTPLMTSADKGPDFVRRLLEAGADVHAVDDAGRSVVDLIADAGEIRALLEMHAGDRPLDAARPLDALELGRRDWIVGGARAGATSTIAIDRSPLRRGEAATLDISLVNDSDADRLLELEALLNDTALFVGATHGGAIADPRRLAPWQTVRWPLLALPARSTGSLSMQILARADEEAGDLTVDLRAYDRIGHGEELLPLYEPMATSAVQLDPRALLYGILPVLIAIGGVGLLLRRRHGRAAKAARPRALARLAAGVSAVLCAGIAVVLAMQAAEPFARFEPASCTVLDRRALTRTAEPVRRSRAERMRYGHLRDGKPGEYRIPLVAVRIDTGAEPVLASGFATGMATRSVHGLHDVALGTSPRCWFDPETPTRFTLTRRPGTAAIVGLGMLVALALLLGLIAYRLGHRTQGALLQDAPGRRAP